MTRITGRRFHESDGVGDWHVLAESACAHFRTGSFAAGAGLVQAISALDGVGPHRPDVDLRHDGVTVRLTTVTDDFCGITEETVALARRISAAARDLGLPSDPSALQSVAVTIDALVSRDVMPFWRALLGYAYRGDSPDEDLIDPRFRGPFLWFQDMDAPRPQRNRMHVDVWVPHHLAQERIAAAVAAGGRVVSSRHAPSGWVLADPEGNEACVATWMGRD